MKSIEYEALPMISPQAAIEWAKRQPDSTIKPRAVKRIEYEIMQRQPVKAKFHKGQYGHKYDYWTCGNCGCVVAEATWKFCAECGKAIEKGGYYG